MQDTLARPAVYPISRQHILKARLVKAFSNGLAQRLFHLTRRHRMSPYIGHQPQWQVGRTHPLAGWRRIAARTRCASPETLQHIDFLLVSTSAILTF